MAGKRAQVEKERIYMENWKTVLGGLAVLWIILKLLPRLFHIALNLLTNVVFIALIAACAYYLYQYFTQKK